MIGVNNWAAELRCLSNVLSVLYDSIEDSRRVVAFAGLNSSLVKFHSAAAINWHNVLESARAQGRLENIIRIAVEDYPENEELKKALHARPGQVVRNIEETEELSSQKGKVLAAQSRYYVSYAWSDEKSGIDDRERIVDQLCEAAEGSGVRILREKSILGFGDSISKFMTAIGQGDRIFVILSDKYLKSPNCMFELSEIWKNSRQDEAEFLTRCRVYTLGDADVWTVLGRLGYASFWKAKFEELDAAVRQLGPSALGQKDFAQYRRMQTFVHQVGDLLAAFADIVQPRTFEDLQKYGLDNLSKMTKAE